MPADPVSELPASASTGRLSTWSGIDPADAPATEDTVAPKGHRKPAASE